MVKKEQLRSKIFNSVIAAEVTKGHMKWKVSDIARATGVSRPLIYYHFGKTKKDILKECLDVLAGEYYGLSPERQQMLKDGGLLQSLLKTRALFLINPALVIFYQKWRMQPDSPLKMQLTEIERRYQLKLKSVFPKLSPLEIEAVHGIFHGLITAPFLTSESLEKALSLIQVNFSGNVSGNDSL